MMYWRTTGRLRLLFNDISVEQGNDEGGMSHINDILVGLYKLQQHV